MGLSDILGRLAVRSARRDRFTGRGLAAAVARLERAVARNPAPKLREALGDLLIAAGEAERAAALFREIEAEGPLLGVSNLIHSGLPVARALVDDHARMLFIPIPKCGCSTVKNYFTAAIHGRTYGGRVHFQHPELYRHVSAEEMKTRYRDYFRFAVVRDPVERLVSYYCHNVAAADALARETMHRQRVEGLSTDPAPAEVAAHFGRYRQVFKDFRHHTDSLSAYLDPFRETLDAIFPMAGLPEVRDRVATAHGIVLEDARAMVSTAGPGRRKRAQAALAVLADQYRTDYETYM